MIELRAGALRLALAPEVGGAVAAFERDGVPLFRPTTTGAIATREVRDFSCYPLVPFSNRIARASLYWDGATYALPRYLPGDPHAIHGNGWQRCWRVVDAEPTQAVLELVHDAAGALGHEWPFPYRATQESILAPDALAMTLEITNTGAKHFPCGLGWHPFFPRTAATELSFVAHGIWATDPTKLPTRLEAIPATQDFSAPRRLGDVVLDNCFTGWRPPATIRWPERELSVAITADAACRHLVVFIPPERDFFAVEPVTHMTDAFNHAASGERDTGTRPLAPGERFSCTMRLSVLPRL